MLTLRNHTHCQVAQKSRHTNRNLPKSIAALSHMDKLRKRKHENLTINIGHLADSAKFENEYN